MNFLGFDASSLTSLGESLTRDIGTGIEQLKKGVEETLRDQDDDGPGEGNGPEDAWSFGAIDSLVKTLVGGEPGAGRADGEEGIVENLEDVEEGGAQAEAAAGKAVEEAPRERPAVTAVTAVMGEGASAVTVAVEEGNPKMNAFGDSVVPGAKTSTKKPRCEPKKKKKPSTVSKARPAAQESGSTNAGTRQGQATLESESVAASSAGAVGPIAPSPPAETAVAATPAETIMKTAQAHVAPRVAESLTDVDDAIQQRIRNLEEKISKQAKDLVVANTRAVKEREEKLELETRLKSKDAEIQEVMEEGEMLSKKQLAMETSMKQMKAQLAKAQRDLSERDSSLQAERQRGEEEASSKADYQAKLDSMRSEHEETVKMLRAELIATERKLSSLSKEGSSEARKLQEAQNKASALQDSLEEAREEMRRQRTSADEREEMLQSEIAVLQRRCSEAEARQKDSESKVPEATAPLLVQVDSLQKKLEDQDRLSMATQKRLVDKIETLDKVVEALRLEKCEYADQAEEATSRYESLYSQLSGAQQKASEAERVASEERLARQSTEASLAQTQAELSNIESSLTTRINALVATEALLKETIRGLEEELINERTRLDRCDARSTVDQASPQQEPTQPRLLQPSQPMSSPTRLFAADDSENTLRRTIRDLEETRDKLSTALVRAEQRASSGDSANGELADLRKKLAAATEVIGEKEETIDELRADLADIKDILASQQDELAAAIESRRVE